MGTLSLMFFPLKVPGEFNFNLTNQNIQAPDIYRQNHVNEHVKEVAIHLKYRSLRSADVFPVVA